MALFYIYYYLLIYTLSTVPSQLKSQFATQARFSLQIYCEFFFYFYFYFRFALLLKFISAIKVINLKTPSIGSTSKERGVCVVTSVAVTTFLEYLLLDVLRCQINCLSHGKFFDVFYIFLFLEKIIK